MNNINRSIKLIHCRITITQLPGGPGGGGGGKPNGGPGGNGGKDGGGGGGGLPLGPPLCCEAELLGGA